MRMVLGERAWQLRLEVEVSACVEIVAQVVQGPRIYRIMVIFGRFPADSVRSPWEAQAP
jgi:hypothetical protein